MILWILLGAMSVLMVLLLVFLFQQIQLRRELQRQPQDAALLLLHQQIESLRQQMGQHLENNGQAMQQQLGQFHQQLNDRLRDSSHILQKSQEQVGSRLDHATKVVGDLQGQLGRLQEANTHLFEVGKDLRSLQEILKTPKLRGSLGEYFLGDLLGQVLPQGSFSLQYSFKNREIVDAIVYLQKQMVCIDSKFPLENFHRFWTCHEDAEKKAIRKIFMADVKKHVDSIASKYIRPEEGTFDFALMYIPAENIYYELIIREASGEDSAWIDHAMKKKVIPVSPNTLYIYLSTIAMGLKGLQIEKTAREMLNQLSRLHFELEKTQEAFRKSGSHLHNARNAHEEAQQRLGKFQDRFEKLQVHDEFQDSLIAPEFQSAETPLFDA